jgi:hypothetical protein
MTFTCVQNDRVRYLRCDSPAFIVRDEQSALDLITASGEHRTHRILIPDACLSDEFFDLKTRTAGLFVQKLLNYHRVCAFVVSMDRVKSDRFREWMREANHGNQYRFFNDVASAEAWLAEA